MNYKPKARASDLVVQESDKELLIYDLYKNKAFSLNETSALVLKYCNGRNSISGISRAIGAELGILISDDIVTLAIEQFANEGLLKDADKVADLFQRTPRREIIKKIGLLSSIALPLVSSIVAPPASTAQSVFVQTCSGPGCECDVSDPNSCDPLLTCNSQAPPVFIGATEVGICSL